MDPTDRQDGHDLPAERAEVSGTDARARERLDRRAEALRSNLKRRKAQSRERAEAERAGRPD
jgi:hypothetical protein